MTSLSAVGLSPSNKTKETTQEPANNKATLAANSAIKWLNLGQCLIIQNEEGRFFCDEKIVLRIESDHESTIDTYMKICLHNGVSLTIFASKNGLSINDRQIVSESGNFQVMVSESGDQFKFAELNH